MKKIVIRNAQTSDIEGIVDVEKLAWTEQLAAKPEMFMSRIETFPDGTLIAEIDGKIIGVVSTEIIEYDVDLAKSMSWKEATDDGYIRKSHVPNGKVLFGVDLSVSPEMQNKGVAKKLLEEIGKMAIKKNLHYAVLGGRIPEYYRYAKTMSAEEYVFAKDKNGGFLDPEVNFYAKAGLRIIKVIPEYFYDPASHNYGVLLLWKNPVYLRNIFIGKLVGKIFSLFFRT